METLQEFITDFIMPRRHNFVRRNPPAWIADDNLRNIYVNTIGPWGSPDPVECWILYKLATLSKGNLLEIGSWRGRSSCFLAQGIKDSEGAFTRKLTCVDWFNGDATGGINPSKEVMIQSLDKFGLTKLVTIFDQDMLKFDFEANTSDIDLVFYDADHQTQPTTTVLKNMHPFLNEKCMVVLHDANWPMTIRAIRAVSAQYMHIKTLPVWEGLGVLVRK